MRACPSPPVQFCFHFLQPRDLRLGLLLRLVEDPPHVRFELFRGTDNNRFDSSGEWHFQLLLQCLHQVFDHAVEGRNAR